MDFFQYQTLIAKIDTTNSYQKLRSIYKKLSESPLDDFYSIHAINKTIKKFKSLTSSHLVKSKEYTGTLSRYFFKGIEYAQTKEQILLLISDWNRVVFISLPSHTKTLIKIIKNLSLSEYLTLSKQLQLGADYYSIVSDRNPSLSERGRLPICIISYLSEVKNTEIYEYILKESLEQANIRFNSSLQTHLIDKINLYIAEYQKEIEYLKEANVYFNNLLKEKENDNK